VTAFLEIEERQVVVEVDLPPQLAFVGGVIEKAVRDNTVKLLR